MKEVDRVRRICLAFPRVEERLSHGEPTWFVGGRVFVTFADHHHDDRVAFWCAAQRDHRDAMVTAAPDRFFVPPFYGVRGWLGIYLDVAVDWTDADDIIRDAYLLIAPGRFAALLQPVEKVTEE